MTRVGLLSDSHGHADITRRAVELLVGAGADLLVHLGDVGSLEVIDALIAFRDTHPTTKTQPPTRPTHGGQIDAHLVFGNTDPHPDAMARYATDLGVTVHDPSGRLTFNDKTMVFLHGHRGHVMADALGQAPDYLCHGHTHVPADHRHGPTRVINPGALHRAREHTVAILDTATDDLQFYPVAKH